MEYKERKRQHEKEVEVVMNIKRTFIQQTAVPVLTSCTDYYFFLNYYYVISTKFTKFPSHDRVLPMPKSNQIIDQKFMSCRSGVPVTVTLQWPYCFGVLHFISYHTDTVHKILFYF